MSFLNRLSLVVVVAITAVFSTGVTKLKTAATVSAKPDKEGSGSGGSAGHGA